MTLEERAQLRTEGVELLKYVPQDAFIAKFDRSMLGRVRSLDFVRWMGSYRPEHKVHARLSAAARSTTTGQSLATTVLLSPAATEAESTFHEEADDDTPEEIDESLPFYLKPLEWLNAPLEALPEKAREVVGKIALLTFFNAAAVLIYVFVFRKHR